MTPTQLLHQFRRAGYATVSHRSTVAEGAWKRACVNERRPLVVVREGPRYATVVVSLSSAARDQSRDPQCSDAAGKWFSEMARDALPRGRRDAAAFHSEGPASEFVVYQIPIVDAHAIARWLITWLSSPAGWLRIRNDSTPDPIPFGWVDDLDDLPLRDISQGGSSA
jgi:hypothetical protein